MSLPSIRVGGIEQGPFGVAVVGGSLVVTGLSVHTPIWASAAVVTVLLVTVAVQVNGRTTSRWLIDWAEYRFGRADRARALTGPAAVEDVEVAAGVCGIRAEGTWLTAMIQLAPNLDLPTVIAEKSIYTEDTVPVDALRGLLDQFGLAVDIDIVTTGQRVRSTGNYSMLYDQLIGSHPVVGHRLTWLVVRLDMERNLELLQRRGPCAVVAPKALATAAHRIAGRLRERSIAAHALPATALIEATRLLHAGVELSDLRETWTCMESSVPGRCVTSFLIDWNRLDGAGLDDCWSWNRGRTTLVVSLTDAAAGPRAIARYIGPPVTDAPPDYLRPLTGQQATALLASLPTGTSIRAVPTDESGDDIAPDELFAELTIAIGPNGQILGSISGQPRHTLALPLVDPARFNPRRRTIDVHADLPVAQQIVLRAMVVGADVEVHSGRPHRWWQLVAAVGDPESLRLAPEAGAGGDGGQASPAPSSATITVFDNMPPQASTAHTTVTISEPGGPRRRSVDLAIDQVSATAVDVSIPMRTVRVDLIEPRGETRYFDSNTQQPAITAGGSGAVIPAAPQPNGHRTS
ncbi:type VII secretion protein EccE [Nocardia sp. NBC_00565]|uniref:type VII secretion protein EccE n=1 Tax=Nocardia sp. NBC_00565 TaxID=2975993 RepID=UPI002E821612|nr:type VII secretion protein EccE [Nocardia sp. NBC_00565]WUC07660.1 type VII secretion protein EccE [Nocardia sp. NBC_00565]